jgi:hypothetical protein
MACHSSLPYQVATHDSLRQGLPAFREDAMLKHPVELVQQEAKKQVQVLKVELNAWGFALLLRTISCFWPSLHIQERAGL